MIAILSAESTGTHFTQHVVKKLTGNTVEWAPHGNKHGFIQHIYPEGFDANADFLISSAFENVGYKRVVPMRHPIKALISNYERGHKRLPFTQHVQAFKRLSNWWDVFWFQVDHPDGPDIGGLATYLGVRYKNVRNEPKNAMPSKRHTVLRTWYAEKDWKSLNGALNGSLDLLSDLQPFFSQFGYEIP